jgi:hypothetical protein
LSEKQDKLKRFITRYLFGFTFSAALAENKNKKMGVTR